jgi:hypothetical protein
MACDSAPRIEQIIAAAAAEGRAVYSTIPIARLPEPQQWRPNGKWERGELAMHAPSPPEPELQPSAR